jgi:hypothetical protein
MYHVGREGTNVYVLTSRAAIACPLIMFTPILLPLSPDAGIDILAQQE